MTDGTITDLAEARRARAFPSLASRNFASAAASTPLSRSRGDSRPVTDDSNRAPPLWSQTRQRRPSQCELAAMFEMGLTDEQIAVYWRLTLFHISVRRKLALLAEVQQEARVWDIDPRA